MPKRAPTAKELKWYDYKTGKKLSVPEAELRGGGWKHWPSCIRPWASHDPILLREDIIEAINDHGLSGGLVKSVNIVKVEGKTLPKPAPAYYWLEAQMKIPVKYRIFERGENSSLSFMFETENLREPRCREACKIPGKTVRVTAPLDSLWDETDFFLVGNSSLFGNFGVSYRFVELAHEKDWDNMTFNLLGVVDRKLGDFRNRPWPPSEWVETHQPIEQ